MPYLTLQIKVLPRVTINTFYYSQIESRQNWLDLMLFKKMKHSEYLKADIIGDSN
jgi:hypothetical protein